MLEALLTGKWTSSLSAQPEVHTGARMTNSISEEQSLFFG